MPINPLIPLSVRTPDVGRVMGQAEQLKAARKQNQLMDLQLQEAPLQAERARQAHEQTMQANAMAIEQARAKSIAQGAVILNEFLKNNDPEGAQLFLESRREAILSRSDDDPMGKDTSHTDRGLEMLLEDPAGLAREVEAIASAAVQTGLVPRPPDRQIREDALGVPRFVDSGEPAFPGAVDPSDLVSPREEFNLDVQKERRQQSEANLAESKERRLARDLSTNMEKNLIEAQDAAIELAANAQELLTIANDFESNPEITSGFEGKAREAVKQAFGTEDAISLLRRRYAAVVNTQVINNLPPGIASDRDIELAREGFLPSTADRLQIASFLRGLAAMEQMNAAFNRFKAEFIAENRNTDGLLQAWDRKLSNTPTGRVADSPDGPTLYEYGDGTWRPESGDQ